VYDNHEREALLKVIDRSTFASLLDEDRIFKADDDIASDSEVQIPSKDPMLRGSSGSGGDKQPRNSSHLFLRALGFVEPSASSRPVVEGAEGSVAGDARGGKCWDSGQGYSGGDARSKEDEEDEEKGVCPR